MNYSRNRPVDPRIGHDNSGVAHASDQVNEKSVPMRLEEPDWIENLALEALLAKNLQGRHRVLRSQKQVEIFGVAANSRMDPQCESSGDRVRHFSAFK